jgi:hypothetical protein
VCCVWLRIHDALTAVWDTRELVRTQVCCRRYVDFACSCSLRMHIVLTHDKCVVFS